MSILTKAVTTIARNLGLRDARLYEHLGVGPTDSGENVTIDGSLQIGTVWACIRLIAQTVASLPMHVYRGNADGYGEVYPRHALYRLLHDRPNYDMTSYEFMIATVTHLMLWGNAYWALSRIGGRITALTPMRPDRVSVRREQDGSLTYTYTWENKTETYAEEDILHIKGFTLDGYIGLSPIAVARNNLGAVRATEKASSAIFKNGMRPSAVLMSKEYLNEKQRAEAKEILQRYKGAQNTGGTPLIEGGWEFKELTIPPNDAQMLETRTFQVEEICRWYGVPPIMVGHVGKTQPGASNTEQLMLHFYTGCLLPLLRGIEQAVDTKLFTPTDVQNGIYAKFSVEGLLRADSTGRASYYSTMVQNGLMTRNEVRALENLPRKDGGDDLTVQSNLMPAADLGVVARLTREKAVTPGAAIAPPSQAQSSPQNGDPKPIPELKQ